MTHDQTSSIHALTKALGQQLLARAWCLAVAESCTGGSLCAAITEVSGSSAWFDRGIITYSNHAKNSLLHVPETTLATQGAVSEETARAMAEGMLAVSDANLTAAITGVAGPTGGSHDKPIGTVWIACATREPAATHATCYLFQGNRQAVRHQAVLAALRDLLKCSAL